MCSGWAEDRGLAVEAEAVRSLISRLMDDEGDWLIKLRRVVLDLARSTEPAVANAGRLWAAGLGVLVQMELEEGDASERFSRFIELFARGAEAWLLLAPSQVTHVIAAEPEAEEKLGEIAELSLLAREAHRALAGAVGSPLDIRAAGSTAGAPKPRKKGRAAKR